MPAGSRNINLQAAKAEVAREEVMQGALKDKSSRRSTANPRLAGRYATRFGST